MPDKRSRKRKEASQPRDLTREDFFRILEKVTRPLSKRATIRKRH
jgi:hypothetical protein